MTAKKHEWRQLGIYNNKACPLKGNIWSCWLFNLSLLHWGYNVVIQPKCHFENIRKTPTNTWRRNPELHWEEHSEQISSWEEVFLQVLTLLFLKPFSSLWLPQPAYAWCPIDSCLLDVEGDTLLAVTLLLEWGFMMQKKTHLSPHSQGCCDVDNAARTAEAPLQWMLHHWVWGDLVLRNK